MRLTPWFLLAGLLAAGCEPGPGTPPQSTPPATTPTSDSHPATSDTAIPAPSTSSTTPPAADNTAVNERDRDTQAKTPIDQNENETDIGITADIRKKVIAQENFSIDARNIKIITADGKVTLRGPVKTQQERDTIEQIALDIAGKEKVDNQIEVTP